MTVPVCKKNPGPAATSRLLGALALAGLLASGCGGDGRSPRGPGGPGGPPGAMGAQPVAVIATEVAAQPYVDRFTALGTARANESIEVTSRISSVITRIAFREGQRVEAGDLLVELDNKEIAANLAMSEASLQKVRSQFERRKALGATRVISEAELEELEAEVRIAEAEVRAAQARLRDSFIRAPFGGTVGLRTVSVGDLVGPDTIITTLDDTRVIKLEFAVPEVFLRTVEPGTPIAARSEVYSGRAFVGEVRQVDSRVDPVTRTVTVIAELPNPENLLKPGMFMTVDVQREREAVVLVPEQALMPRQGRQFVYVVEDGKAVEKEVVLGIRAPGVAEIRQGVTPGDLVITEGAQKVRSGSPVEVLSSG